MIDVTKLTDERKKAIIESLSKGASIADAARAARCARETVYYWMHRDPEFAKLCKQSRMQMVQVVWGEAFRLAQTEEYEEIKQWVDDQGRKRVERVTKIRWASIPAIDLILRNWDKDYVQHIPAAEAGMSADDLVNKLAAAIVEIESKPDVPPPEDIDDGD